MTSEAKAGSSAGVATGSSSSDSSGERQERQKIPMFEGEGTATEVSEAYRDWEESFEAYLTAMRITNDGRKLAQARLGMKEGSAARTWFVTSARNPEMRWVDWDDCKAAMRQRFLVVESPAQTSAVRAKLWMKDEEDVRRFADRCFQFQTNLRLAHDLLDMPGVPPDHKEIVLNAVAQHDRKHAFMSGLKPSLREQVGGVLDTNAASYREIVDAACRYEQSAQDKQVAAGAVHAVGAGAAAGNNRNDNRKRGSGGQASGASKTTSRPGWVRLKQLPSDVCFNCGYSGHQAATCSVPPEKQVWDATLKRLGLSKKKGGAGGAASSAAGQQQQAVHSANLIDVVAQHQQQLRLLQQQQQPMPPPAAPVAGPPMNPFQGFPGAPLPAQLPTSPPQGGPAGGGTFSQPGVQALQGGPPAGSYADF